MHRGLGRKHPKEFYRRSTDAIKHTKMAQDNIIIKIKAAFYRSIINYVNYIYEESSKNKYPEKKINQKFIQKIDSSEPRKI